LLQGLETEASRDILQQEIQNLRRRLAETENGLCVKVKELQGALEDHDQTKAQFEEKKQELERVLDTVTEDLSEIRLTLSASEGRVLALEDKLNQTEAEKRTVEEVCGSIVSSLRRTIGFNPTSQTRFRARSASPAKSSPGKGVQSAGTAWIINYNYRLHSYLILSKLSYLSQHTGFSGLRLSTRSSNILWREPHFRFELCDNEYGRFPCICKQAIVNHSFNFRNYTQSRDCVL